MKRRQIYSRTPEVCNSYCLFLDVLGFQQEILSNYSNGQAHSHLRRFYKAFKSATKPLTSNPLIWKYNIFTDNIVLGSPVISTPNSESIFGAFISCVVSFQLEMVLSNFFIRGGWSLGDLYIGNNIVYGESLIRAYEAESKSACYPRIVFTEEMKRNINEHLKYYRSPEDSPHFYHVLKDENDQYFINYLSDIIYFDESTFIDFELLSKHKAIIESRLQQHKADQKIYLKYLWTAQYHNFFSETFINQCPSEYFIDIRIPDRNFQTL